MSRGERVAGAVTRHTRLAIVVLLVATATVGAGVGMVDQSSSLSQFQSDSPAAQKLDYVESNFSTGPNNTTSAQLVVRGENVLSKASLVDTLELERALRDNATVNRTLVDGRAIVGVPNVVATAAIRQEQARELRAKAAKLRELNRSVQRERAALRNESAALERRRAELNATTRSLRGTLTRLERNRSTSVRAAFERVDANASVALDEEDYATFNRSARLLRTAENRSQVESAYELGTRGVLADELRRLGERGERLRDRSENLTARVDRLRSLAGELQRDRAALENASAPTLDAQLEQLRSMNATEIDRTVETVLSADGGSGAGAAAGAGALVFMPTSYEPGSTTANATMLAVTQSTDGGASVQGTASDRIVDAQLAMGDVARSADAGGLDVVVFGAGVISEEMNNSMGDSLLIVGPLALLFVLVALVVAYRDALDILLGLLGLVAVLVWTFGFMGWAGIAFNQLFIAVPVLLIGLSVDYAIHIFMRHREERHTVADGVRGSMKVALSGVGVALVWVTATTVIGFLSNLTSPVPPIREFGVVSSVGIAAALLVYGVLVPALKVELDSFLESRGVDRRKRAFGTGGGGFSRALSVGSVAARKAPWAVVLLAVLVSAGGAYGATQVDTSFSQEDFIAGDPPAWTDDLPEPFRPHDYSAKQHLDYVNSQFVREDSRAQLLIQGNLTAPGALERVDRAAEAAATKDVTHHLPNGEANVRGPVSVMAGVTAQNATFNATFAAADSDGDGVPDRNLEGVYDALFATAPDRAADVIHRTDDGEYRALRMVVSVRGNAAGDAVTRQMRDVAAVADGGGLEATATGQAILFEIVQDQLLETVVQSLVITLLAVFAFLMVTYRVTEGSATLGAVTLLPVVFSVAWILGTMYVLDIPFNVMTGMITSLTVGLGVAYSIHVSERYNQELERTSSVWEAMHRTVTGTGGALLGSAATTIGGFGVLGFAILPPLRQFGVITGLTIAYAFLASVLVLPSLLVLWTKYLGPDFATTDGRAASADVASDGGTDAE